MGIGLTKLTFTRIFEDVNAPPSPVGLIKSKFTGFAKWA